MRILRLLGGVLAIAGLGFLAGDVVVFLAGETGFRLHALGWWWNEIHRDSLLLLQPAVERHLSPAIWNPGIQTLLEWPLVPQLLILGAALRLVGRKRRKDRLNYIP